MNAFELETKTFFHTYKRLPLEIDHGEGVHLVATDGSRYLDMFAGLAVNALGYGHPAILKAIQDQAGRYIHLSNYFLQTPQLRLAEKLLAYSGFARVFFSNSGTEAIEGALKLVRKWGAAHDKSEILSFSNAFHGRTMGALSLMDRPKYRNGYEPFLRNCVVVDFNNSAALHDAVSERTAAVVLEFIQGEGGIRPVSPEFVDTLRKLRAKHGFLIVADEIQSGIGRTGKAFGVDHFGIVPDIIVVAKPIGGGLPLGAILGNTSVAEIFEPGGHGTTFGGNPVACAAGTVVLEEVFERGLMQRAEHLGALLKSSLLALREEFPALVREVRGFGLMMGMELTRPGDPVVEIMRRQHILVNCTDTTVIRLLPPLTIDEGHVHQTATALRSALAELPAVD